MQIHSKKLTISPNSTFLKNENEPNSNPILRPSKGLCPRVFGFSRTPLFHSSLPLDDGEYTQAMHVASSYGCGFMVAWFGMAV
jgi:hypothetical protein